MALVGLPLAGLAFLQTRTAEATGLGAAAFAVFALITIPLSALTGVLSFVGWRCVERLREPIEDHAAPARWRPSTPVAPATPTPAVPVTLLAPDAGHGEGGWRRGVIDVVRSVEPDTMLTFALAWPPLQLTFGWKAALVQVAVLAPGALWSARERRPAVLYVKVLALNLALAVLAVGFIALLPRLEAGNETHGHLVVLLLAFGQWQAALAAVTLRWRAQPPDDRARMRVFALAAGWLGANAVAASCAARRFDDPLAWVCVATAAFAAVTAVAPPRDDAEAPVEDAAGFPWAAFHAWTALLALAAVALVAVPPRRRDPSTTRSDMRELRREAETWRANHGGAAGCPDVDALVRDRLLPPEARLDDAWGGPFRITCFDDETVVSSAGPDRAWSTDDDVAIPETPRP